MGHHSKVGTIASAVRSDRARPHPFRIVVELDLPFRSIHTGAETEARLLRVAAPLARSRHRLDESDGEKWCAARRSRLRAEPATKGSRFPARARCRAGPDTVLPWTSYLTNTAQWNRHHSLVPTILLILPSYCPIGCGSDRAIRISQFVIFLRAICELY